MKRGQSSAIRNAAKAVVNGNIKSVYLLLYIEGVGTSYRRALFNALRSHYHAPSIGCLKQTRQSALLTSASSNELIWFRLPLEQIQMAWNGVLADDSQYAEYTIMQEQKS